MQYTIVGLGEILWDILPSGKVLGGAPANFLLIQFLPFVVIMSYRPVKMCISSIDVDELSCCMRRTL